MTYAAFLRGINVGGNNMIGMAALKAALERAGFEGVRTYIQSGNVVFESPEKDTATLSKRIEKVVLGAFGVASRVVVVSRTQLKSVLAGAPSAWAQPDDLRCNVAFLCPPVTSKEAVKHVRLTPDVDSASAGKGVLYMSTLLSAASRSSLSKSVRTPVYGSMTVRTFGTCQKVLALMEERG
jgi:uncharacterized protein (DUF1697 family)